MKRWTDSTEWDQKVQIIHLLLRNQNKIIKDITKNQVQRKNLYTLPEAFIDRLGDLPDGFDSKILETLFLGRFETIYSSAISASIDLGRIPDARQTYSIVMFAIIQSFRTTKFYDDNIEIIKKTFAPSSSWTDHFSIHLAVLTIRGLPLLIKNARATIFINNSATQFITSDNPATYWLGIRDLRHVKHIALNQEIVGNSHLKIILPLSPKFLLRVSLNTTDRIKGKKIAPIIREASLKEVIEFNEMIYTTSQQIIFGTSEEDLKIFVENYSLVSHHQSKGNTSIGNEK